MNILTVKCKIDPSEEQIEILDRTLVAFAQGCNFALDQGREAKTSSNIRIHHLSYHLIRKEFGLPANLAVRAIARASGILKVKSRINSIIKPSSIDLDQRIFSFHEKEEKVGITTIDGRIKIPLILGEYQRNLLSGKCPTSAVLGKTRNGQWYINIQIKLPDPPLSSQEGGCLGVDMGIRRIASTSDGKTWDGEKLTKTRNKFQRTRESLQKAKAQRKTRSISRLLKRLSGRERRFQTHVNHEISRSLVDQALETKRMIALEDLTGIRSGMKVCRKQRRTHHCWAFHQLRSLIAYKALLEGIEVFLVDPAYTSQTCSCCGERGQRKSLLFTCKTCGTLDADINAAKNIAFRGLRRQARKSVAS